MRSSRIWAVRMVLFVGGALVAAGCWSLPGVQSPSVVSGSNEFGKAKGRACKKNGNPVFDFVCRGHPPRDFADGADDPALLGWLAQLDQERNWEPLSDKFERPPAEGEIFNPTMRVQAIREPQRFRFADHDDRAYVMARIIASPRGPKDRRYDIGGDPNSTLDDTFYVVVRGFIPDDFTPPADTTYAGPSRPISRWAIYGVQRGGGPPRLEEMSTGVLRWCDHAHLDLQKEKHASFEYCKKPMPVRNFVASQRLFDPPLWFTCGIGCCVADFM